MGSDRTANQKLLIVFMSISCAHNVFATARQQHRTLSPIPRPTSSQPPFSAAGLDAACSVSFLRSPHTAPVVEAGDKPQVHSHCRNCSLPTSPIRVAPLALGGGQCLRDRSIRRKPVRQQAHLRLPR